MRNKDEFDIVIIGAGAAGLMAAYVLSMENQAVLIVEARDRIGGRIYTNTPASFSTVIERGAEFIHGEATLTFDLLKKAGIDYEEVDGKMYRVEHNELSKTNFFNHEWETMLDELKKLEQDMTLEQFMQMRFPKDKNEHFYESIRRFVEGYNAADFTRVSAMALKEEWGEEEDPAQYRITGGYGRLIDYLHSTIVSKGGQILVDTKVDRVRWSRSDVQVDTIQRTFTCRQCIVTVPTSLLSSKEIKFEPELPEYAKAADGIGFGGVSKITFEFHDTFWESETGRKFKSAQFIFTDGDIPTWWTQSPSKRPLLTGWVGGPSARDLDLTNEEFLQIGIKTLSYAFDYPAFQLKEKLKAWNVDQWLKDRYAQGAYSYMMVGSDLSIELLLTPVENTLYFAGEALYIGPHKSTVEAALTSGRNAARKILSSR